MIMQHFVAVLWLTPCIPIEKGIADEKEKER